MTNNLTDELVVTARQALSGLDPVPMGEEQGGLSFRRLIAAVFRARFLVFGTTLFGLLIGSFLAITTANQYVSTGTFQFSASGAETAGFDPTRAATASHETIATSATYILNSEELRKRVVDKLGPARILQPYQPGGGPEDIGARALFFQIQRDWNDTREADRTPDAAIKFLEKTVLVERPRFTDVLLATCKANNAQLAQEILATFMDEGIKLHIDKYDEPKLYEEAKKSYADAQARQIAARNALTEFIERDAMVDDFDLEKRKLQTESTEAGVQLRKLEVELSIKKTQIAAYAKMFEGPDALKPYITVKDKPGLRAEDFTRLDEALNKAELDLMKAEGVYTNPKADELVQKRKEVEFWKKRIEDRRLAARTAEAVEMDVPNPEYRRSQEQKANLEAEVITTNALLESAKTQQEKQSNALKALLALEPKYESLRTVSKAADADVVSTGIIWDAAQKKRALGLGNYSSLKLIEAATLPIEKEGPNRGKLLLGGLAVGLFLGLGIVVLRSLPDTVVRTRSDLERIDGLAVIGIMPRLDSANLRRHVALREQGW